MSMPQRRNAGAACCSLAGMGVLGFGACALALYGARLTALPIRGEETRRAQVACEMVQTGDWIVPRQQGQPLLSRPPLGNYPIALAAIAFGDCSLLAVRLPTMLATWLTVLLIYGYGRLFLSRLGALAAGLAYAHDGAGSGLGPAGRDGSDVYAAS